MYRSHVHRNPEPASEAMIIQRMRKSFHPHFLARHLTRSSMQELTGSFVADDHWNSLDTSVNVSCLPGQPLRVNVRTFIPRQNIFSVQKDPESQSFHTHNSLPVAIYGADPLKLAQSFNKYLNNIVETHCAKHSNFVLQVRTDDHSSRVLDILFEWFYEWRETVRPLNLHAFDD
jgi:hypothetical protein